MFYAPSRDKCTDANTAMQTAYAKDDSELGSFLSAYEVLVDHRVPFSEGLGEGDRQ